MEKSDVFGSRGIRKSMLEDRDEVLNRNYELARLVCLFTDEDKNITGGVIGHPSKSSDELTYIGLTDSIELCKFISIFLGGYVKASEEPWAKVSPGVYKANIKHLQDNKLAPVLSDNENFPLNLPFISKPRTNISIDNPVIAPVYEEKDLKEFLLNPEIENPHKWLEDLQKDCRNAGGLIGLFHDENGKIISGIIAHPRSAYDHHVNNIRSEFPKGYKRDYQEPNVYVYAPIIMLSKLVRDLFGGNITASLRRLSFLTSNESIDFKLNNSMVGSDFTTYTEYFAREDGQAIRSVSVDIMQGESYGVLDFQDDVVRISRHVLVGTRLTKVPARMFQNTREKFLKELEDLRNLDTSGEVVITRSLGTDSFLDSYLEQVEEKDIPETVLNDMIYLRVPYPAIYEVEGPAEHVSRWQKLIDRGEVSEEEMQELLSLLIPAHTEVWSKATLVAGNPELMKNHKEWLEEDLDGLQRRKDDGPRWEAIKNGWM